MIYTSNRTIELYNAIQIGFCTHVQVTVNASICRMTLVESDAAS
jgi:hypothetical protein